MLPTRLEIHNFLAYRAPEPIVFAGIGLGVPDRAQRRRQVVALWMPSPGRYGAGRGPRRDEELIHLGQNEMRVSIDFEQEGIHYRVVRRRARAGTRQPRRARPDGLGHTQTPRG